MKTERRINNRKETYPLTISSITSTDSLAKLIRAGVILNASARGMLIQIKRTDIIPRSLKGSLTLEALVGDQVVVKIEEMNLEISGKITRTRLLGKQGFELAVDYSGDSPEYWRECLMDLLPSPNEFNDSDEDTVVPLKGYKRPR